jgi:hypothetical protein
MGMHIESFDRYSNPELPDTMWFDVESEGVLRQVYVTADRGSVDIDTDQFPFEHIDLAETDALIAEYFAQNPGDLLD